MTSRNPEMLPDPGPGEWRAADGCRWWETALGPARLVMSTRFGGESTPPYDSLNLGLHVGDAPRAVIENRRRIWGAAGSGLGPPVVAAQVHGAAAAFVTPVDAGRGWQDQETALPETDALVTSAAGIALSILVADCAPVALVSPAGALGMVHAGWRGLAAGVLEAALRQMAALGGAPDQCQAVIGPCIRACCYEVGEEVWRYFPAACLAPAERPGAHRLDLMAAVVHRLREAGLSDARIYPSGLCTACYPELFFSHRRATRERQRTTGRMALFGWLG